MKAATKRRTIERSIAAVVVTLGLLGTIAGMIIGALNIPFAILFFLFAYGFGTVLSVATLLLEEISYHRSERLRDRARLLIWALLETFGYRQLTVIWRLRGMLSFLRGRHEWGAMERRGFNVAQPTGAGVAGGRERTAAAGGDQKR